MARVYGIIYFLNYNGTIENSKAVQEIIFLDQKWSYLIFHSLSIIVQICLKFRNIFTT